MITKHPLLATAGACFPATPLTLAGVFAYGAYLVWLAMREVAVLGDTSYVLFLAALAAAGSWIGGCASYAARWPGVRFVPGFVPMVASVAAFASVCALGANVAAAWAGGLNPLTFAGLGPLVVAAGLVGGCTRPALMKYLFLGVGILHTLATSFDPSVPLLIRDATGTMPLILALAATGAFAFWFVRQLRSHRVISRLTANTKWLSWNPPLFGSGVGYASCQCLELPLRQAFSQPVARLPVFRFTRGRTVR